MELTRTEAYRNRGRPKGFTVLELLISLAAIGIVVLITVPGSTLLLEKYRIKSASGSIITSLELARTEAAARSSTVLMCPSSNGHTCRQDGDWDYGWLVFSDGNGDGAVQDIELIQAFEAPARNIHIHANGAVHTKAAFTAVGLVQDNQERSGLFEICLEDSGTPPTVVSVDTDGWVQQIPSGDESCLTG